MRSPDKIIYLCNLVMYDYIRTIIFVIISIILVSKSIILVIYQYLLTKRIMLVINVPKIIPK